MPMLPMLLLLAFLLASQRLAVLSFDWPEGHRSLPGGLGHRHCNTWRVYCALAGNGSRKPLRFRIPCQKSSSQGSQRSGCGQRLLGSLAMLSAEDSQCQVNCVNLAIQKGN